MSRVQTLFATESMKVDQYKSRASRSRGNGTKGRTRSRYKKAWKAVVCCAAYPLGHMATEHIIESHDHYHHTS